MSTKRGVFRLGGIGAKLSALALLAAVGLFGSSVYATSITQEFLPKEELLNGNIVSVDNETKTVFKTNSVNINLMYGVVAEKGSIAFSTPEETDAIAVANSGIMPVLVSTVNGDISEGDPVTVNTIAGIGEKATYSGRIIGIALSGLHAGTDGAVQTTIDYNGEQRQIHVGTVNLKVGASDYIAPTSPLDQADASNRNMLEKIADNIVGKIVKPLGLIIAALILIIGAFASIFLITSSSYSSMISIGRNPLAEKKVIRSLVGLIFVAIGIFGTSVGLAYLSLVVLG